MRVQVRYDRCEGHAECAKIAPSVFAIGDDDEQVRLIDETPDEALRADIALAARRCPTQAITLSD